MKFSEKWLREWVNPSITADELVEQVTMAGLEVDAIEPVAGAFTGVVVGEIVSLEQHPDADKLRVCQVRSSDKDETVQVVCGAPNAAAGLRIPFAQVGAELPGGFKIKKAKLRGVESFGMLCGASELGMEDQVDGLMELPVDAVVGQCLREYLDLDDNIIEVDLTPNRGDCLSILGVARDVGVMNDLDITLPQIDDVAAAIDDQVAVKIEAAEDCPRYLGRVIKGVDLTKQTPLWMQEKLRRGGVRSIDPVVDVTNYVLLELGQPMHAFDLAKVDGSIIVRKAKPSEKLTLLDGEELELKEDSLVIADESRALALAGIMGGEDSGVSAETKDILLESAFFAPIKIAGRARDYGLHTDSSHRFERGVDYAGQKRAIERATALLIDIVGGKPGPVLEAASSAKQEDVTVLLTPKRLKQVLGLELADSLVTNILERLGLIVTVSAEGWSCKVPSWRFDIAIEADLIEEIARIYGYNELPVRELKAPVAFKQRKEAVRPVARLKKLLVDRGYQEAITYSFIEPELQSKFDDADPVAVANPISSDMSVMRTSIVPGLVASMLHNTKRQQPRVRIFEEGLVFVADGKGGFQQERKLSGLICGSRTVESWAENTEAVDFYDLKGDVEALLKLCGAQDVEFKGFSVKGLHPGQTARVSGSAVDLGHLGALHPELAKSLGIAGSAFIFELSLDKLTEGNVPNFKQLSKFPKVRRDIALSVKEDLASAQILKSIESCGVEAFSEAWIFDVYRGEGVEEGQKSVAVAISFQHPERSLTEEDIQPAVDQIVQTLKNELGASLRG